jgi:hypothetical protein
MKISINVDCTPEEARTFLGLPDVTELHHSMMAEVQKKMSESMGLMEPEAFVKTWLPMGLQGMEAFQKMMWDAASGALDPTNRGGHSDKT